MLDRLDSQENEEVKLKNNAPRNQKILSIIITCLIGSQLIFAITFTVVAYYDQDFEY
jgi:hypothetical protein